MEEDEEDEGYAIGEKWDGGLRDSEASRSFGGCLGQGETADIFQEQREAAGLGGSVACTYIHRGISLVLVTRDFRFSLQLTAHRHPYLMISDCLGPSSRPK